MSPDGLLIEAQDWANKPARVGLVVASHPGGGEVVVITSNTQDRGEFAFLPDSPIPGGRKAKPEGAEFPNSPTKCGHLLPPLGCQKVRGREDRSVKTSHVGETPRRVRSVHPSPLPMGRLGKGQRGPSTIYCCSVHYFKLMCMRVLHLCAACVVKKERNV